MANMNTNSAMVTLTPDQIASLPANEQQAYLQRMTPAQQSLVAQAGQQQIVQANRHFMRKSVERTAMCPVTGGSGQTATYAAGQTLYFDFPTVPGFAKGITTLTKLSNGLARKVAAASRGCLPIIAKAACKG